MATVHRALLRGMGGFQREIVIKRILPEMAADEHFVKMFIAEAKLSAQLEHPNIVQIYDFGRVENSYFIAMEYLDGMTLLAFIKRHGRTTPVMEAAAAFICQQVLHGLDYAHRSERDGRPLQLVHRDVSPANVMLTRHGAVKILDFGIAKAVEAIEREDTRTGTLKGKWSYMSPEQVEGKAATAQSDIFSAGIILWEMLTCRRLFKAKTDFLTLANVVRARVPPVTTFRPDISPEFDQICARALARFPEDRYLSAEEMAEDLERLVERHPFGPTQLAEAVSALSGEDLRASSPSIGEVASASSSVSESAVGFRVEDPSAGSASGVHGPFSAAVARRGLTLSIWIGIGIVAVLGGAVAALGLVGRRSASEQRVQAPAKSQRQAVTVIRVASDPSGAKLFVGAETRARGVTPMALELGTGALPVAIRIASEGYRPLNSTITSATGKSLSVTLKRLARPRLGAPPEGIARGGDAPGNKGSTPVASPAQAARGAAPAVGAAPGRALAPGRAVAAGANGRETNSGRPVGPPIAGRLALGQRPRGGVAIHAPKQASGRKTVVASVVAARRPAGATRGTGPGAVVVEVRKGGASAGKVPRTQPPATGGKDPGPTSTGGGRAKNKKKVVDLMGGALADPYK